MSSSVPMEILRHSASSGAAETSRTRMPCSSWSRRNTSPAGRPRHRIRTKFAAVGKTSRPGIRRFGDALVPLDDALVRAVVDVSGRPYIHYAIDIPKWQMLGDYDVFLTPEFFRAVVLNAGLTAHLDLVRGDNPHHIVEAAFKAFARALDAATSIDPRVAGVPSTKGAL